MAGAIRWARRIIVIEDALPAYWFEDVARLLGHHGNDVLILLWDWDIGLLPIATCKRLLVPTSFSADVRCKLTAQHIDVALVVPYGVVDVDVTPGDMPSVNLS